MEERVFIQGLGFDVLFHIGKKQSDNFKAIDKGKPTDLWFHAKDISSCHVVCILPDSISKKELKYIIKMGALLCKQHTNKLKTIRNVEFIYTEIRNITKTEQDGCVLTLTSNTKTICV